MTKRDVLFDLNKVYIQAFGPVCETKLLNCILCQELGLCLPTKYKNKMCPNIIHQRRKPIFFALGSWECTFVIRHEEAQALVLEHILT